MTNRDRLIPHPAVMPTATLIVDDRSTDNTTQAVQEYEVGHQTALSWRFYAGDMHCQRGLKREFFALRV